VFDIFASVSSITFRLHIGNQSGFDDMYGLGDSDVTPAFETGPSMFGLGSMFHDAPAPQSVAQQQQQHQPHRRVHLQQHGQTSGGFATVASQQERPLVQVDQGLPPRHHTMMTKAAAVQQGPQGPPQGTYGTVRASVSAGPAQARNGVHFNGLDPSMFQSTLTEPKQVQTGSFVHPRTGEVIPIMEKELPPPNTNMGYIPPKQLEHTNRRMVSHNGGYDHNNPPRPKTEVYNDAPQHNEGTNVFGSQIYAAQIRARQDEAHRRQQFMNRNGMVPERVGAEHKITQVRFTPNLPPTQELDPQGMMHHAQVPDALQSGTQLPDVYRELKQEVHDSHNVRVPVRQPGGDHHMAMPLPTQVAPPVSQRDHLMDPARQGHIQSGHKSLPAEQQFALEGPTVREPWLRVHGTCST
jgi:hypothetical protein